MLGIVTSPVDGFTLGTGAPGCLGCAGVGTVIVTLWVVAVCVPTLSLVRTLPIVPVAVVGVKLSPTAVMVDALTVIVTTALSQAVVLDKVAHIWYTIV